MAVCLGFAQRDANYESGARSQPLHRCNHCLRERPLMAVGHGPAQRDANDAGARCHCWVEITTFGCLQDLSAAGLAWALGFSANLAFAVE